MTPIYLSFYVLQLQFITYKLSLLCIYFPIILIHISYHNNLVHGKYYNYIIIHQLKWTPKFLVISLINCESDT